MSGRRWPERGQASVELVGLILLVSLTFAALLAVSPVVDGRSVGGFLAHHVICAATRGCHEAEQALELAYGEEVAGALREHAPNLVYEPGERELPWTGGAAAGRAARTHRMTRASTPTWATGAVCAPPPSPM